MKQRWGALDDACVAMQGFGNVGGWTARTMHERGARIVAISDKFGGIYNPRGLRPAPVAAPHPTTGTVVGYNGSERDLQ
jgi:glutamate dehydrogenase/leucine dehydrogenase